MAEKSMGVLLMLEEMAAKEVDLAAEVLAKSMQLADEAKAKQALLAGYKQDYVNNLHQLLGHGVSADTYQNFQQFFAKLDQAVIGQHELVVMANQQVQLHRQLWQESQRKRLSYQVLLKCSDKRALKIEQKKDQKMMDEFAMRSARSRSSS